jgi:two-component system, chemotaxis family, sensor kinase CheA
MQSAPRPEERSDSGAPPTTRSVETFSAELAPSPRASVRKWSGPSPSSPDVGRGLTIFQKLLILILSLMVISIAAQTAYLSVRQLSRMEVLLELKAEMYARLVSKQVESAIAFNDKETAREVFEALDQDPELESVTLFAGDGTLLTARGEITPSLVEDNRQAQRPHVIALSQRVAAVVPVVSLEGPRGTLVLELSTERLRIGRADVIGQALIGGALALLVGALGAYWIARSLGNRLKAIAGVAGAVAQGRLDEPGLDDDGSDEIGSLAGAFNTMLLQLRALIGQMQKNAAEEQRRLGQLVAERTSELDSRNADMRLVLDHVGQGFVMIGRDGTMSRERSAILERWLGPAPDSDRFADYLGQISQRTGAWFALGWQAVLDGELPLELELDQLPKALTVGERVIHIGYRPIFDAKEQLERVLAVLSDLTPELERSRAEADERELTLLCTRLFSDPDGIVEFRAEVDGLIDEIGRGAELDALRRALHTLKGSASLYGVDSMAVLGHELEEQLNEHGSLSPEQIAPLVRRWTALKTKLDVLLENRSGRLDVELDEYRELLQAIEQGAPRSHIQRTLLDWQLESVYARLARLAEHAERLADRLDKGPIEVRVEAGKLRLAREPWAEFWSSVVHVVRNAVDHGLEDPRERERLGKTVPARIVLAARVAGERLLVEVKDDGRGVDWDAVADKARAHGLPAATSADLVAALFTSGVSTRAIATDVSGRGVGLDVLKEACARSGGTIEVESRRGEGTTFRFSWPVERADSARPTGLHAPASHRLSLRRHEGPSVSSSEITAKGPLQVVSK